MKEIEGEGRLEKSRRMFTDLDVHAQMERDQRARVNSTMKGMDENCQS